MVKAKTHLLQKKVKELIIDETKASAEYKRYKKYDPDFEGMSSDENRHRLLLEDYLRGIQKPKKPQQDPQALHRKELRARIRELEKENRKYAEGLHQLNQDPNPKSDPMTMMHVSDIIGDNYRSILRYKNALKELKKK